ncbi:MAG: hypothetical protein GXO79_13070, partial [Chlorobi bacterium]|nr:hypothetical protein [Chlorobiota bacterium]
MKKKITFLLAGMFVAFATLIQAQTATQPSGSGTSGDPYQIATLNNLYWLSQADTAWGRYYIQTADIDASASSSWDDGDGGDAEGFSPIGNSSTRFTGEYNGDGYKIIGIYINRSATSYIGSFGSTLGATIKNIGITDANVSGKGQVGVLIGSCNSTDIINCYCTGVVNGTDSYVGGLVGYSLNSSSLQNCYNASNVNGTGYVGGIVGSNYVANVSNCYNTGAISGNTWYVAGLVGFNNNSSTINYCYSTGDVEASGYGRGLVGGNSSSTVSNSFWNTETSGQTTSAAGSGKTTAEMKDVTTYTSIATTGLDAAWDFVTNPNDDAANDDVWDIYQQGNDYPILSWQTEADIYLSGPNGYGTSGDPYQITDLDDLKWITDNTTSWDKYFIQTTDINASATSSWDSNAGFSPIGNSSNKFTGSYNGQGYAIDSLFINRPTTDYVALFGYNNGVIKNLGITNADITGQDKVACLVGMNYITTITNCYSTGSVNGSASVGGFVSYTFGGTISNCYNSANVSGESRVGGFAGYHYNGANINNCYNTGDVTRTTGSTDVEIGGFIGYNQSANINYCYSSGSVSYDGVSNPTDKGFIGNYSFGTLDNSFWNSDVSNQTTATGATAKTTAEMKNHSTFTDQTTTGLTTAWDFINNPD